MMEVGGLRGKSAEHVRSFLAAIGTHWIPASKDSDKRDVLSGSRFHSEPRVLRHPACVEPFELTLLPHVEDELPVLAFLRTQSVSCMQRREF